MPAVTQQGPRLEQCDLGRVAHVLTQAHWASEVTVLRQNFPTAHTWLVTLKPLAHQNMRPLLPKMVRVI